MPDGDVFETVQVDEVLDGLSSPSSSDVWRALHGFSAESVAASAARRAVEGGGGGGSLPDWWEIDSTPEQESLVLAPTGDSQGETVLEIRMAADPDENSTNAIAVKDSDGIGRLTVSNTGDFLVTLADPPSGARARFRTGEGAVLLDMSDTGELGFFGATPAAQPEIPASPTAQDIVDALVALGLATQA